MAKFGIDGDNLSDERQNGTFIGTGSHDWFQKTGGNGLGLIDTTGGAAQRTLLMSGANIAFSKRMPFMRYSVQDGVVLMDACYARDYMSNDKTSFSGNGTKNTASPFNWGTSPAGGNVSDKTDILDSYVSMRRNGTEVLGNNIGNLVATMALSTFATSGDRYADFEFYKERINYNTVTGSFENSGPAAYGGHSLWEFNADGSVKAWGDMTISFTFNGSSVSNIKIFIWVAKTAYELVKPKSFDFVANEFYESVSVSGYGYAAINAKSTTQIVALGAVNTAATAAPLWGSNSKDNGSNSNSYFTNQYSIGQFAEAAVDFTALGIDPATYMNMSACNPPFTRFMTKSRSSSSFASSLSDFNGPFEFLDVPVIPAGIIKPVPLTCSVNSVSLSPVSYLSGAFYSWRTADGRISGSNNDSSAITIDKPGTYYLTAAITKGCVVNVDSVVVGEDRTQPVATAGVSGMVFPGQKVTLYGGDTTASNLLTAFGKSQGLTWKWIGPLSFTSTEQNPQTGFPGAYNLVVTEKRNGCSDTAFVMVIPYPTLPVTFRQFSIHADPRTGQQLLTWEVADASNAAVFLVEKSTNGEPFAAFDSIPASTASLSYSLRGVLEPGTTTYRIKAKTVAGTFVYSPVVTAAGSAVAGRLVTIYKNSAGHLVFQYQAARPAELTYAISSGAGQIIAQGKLPVQAGMGRYEVLLPPYLQQGVYFVQALNKEHLATMKIRL